MKENNEELDCPYDFTSRCTYGRCDCKPKNAITSADKTQEPIMYSEEEVKELFTKLIQDYPIHSARMRELIPKWFEQNKKK